MLGHRRSKGLFGLSPTAKANNIGSTTKSFELSSPILSSGTDTDMDGESVYASLEDIGLEFGPGLQVDRHQWCLDYQKQQAEWSQTQSSSQQVDQ